MDLHIWMCVVGEASLKTASISLKIRDLSQLNLKVSWNPVVTDLLEPESSQNPDATHIEASEDQLSMSKCMEKSKLYWRHYKSSGVAILWNGLNDQSSSSRALLRLLRNLKPSTINSSLHVAGYTHSSRRWTLLLCCPVWTKNAPQGTTNNTYEFPSCWEASCHSGKCVQYHQSFLRYGQKAHGAATLLKLKQAWSGLGQGAAGKTSAFAPLKEMAGYQCDL